MYKKEVKMRREKVVKVDGFLKEIIKWSFYIPETPTDQSSLMSGEDLYVYSLVTIDTDSTRSTSHLLSCVGLGESLEKTENWKMMWR